MTLLDEIWAARKAVLDRITASTQPHLPLPPLVLHIAPESHRELIAEIRRNKPLAPDPEQSVFGMRIQPMERGHFHIAPELNATDSPQLPLL